MNFGLFNVPVTFQRAMDIVLFNFKMAFCVVTLDSADVYSESVEAIFWHVANILLILQKSHTPIESSKYYLFCFVVMCFRIVIILGVL